MSIESLREEINRIDREIIRLIAKRQALAEKIVRIKIGEGLSVHDEARVQEVLKLSFNYAVEHKINPVYIQKIMGILVEMSEERQRECSGEGNLP
ncbi:MAG TPA: chorismate mutase [Methanoregulaceae archaeon]|nr:chorismate mutase [Methanoregulaceae archaeon]